MMLLKKKKKTAYKLSPHQWAYYYDLHKQASDQKSDAPNQLSKMSYSEIMRATKNFSFDLIIHDRGFKKVYKGTLPNKVNVAVKRYAAPLLFPANSLERRDLRGELMTLSQISHRGIVRFIGFSEEMCELLLVYQYMEKETLGHHLRRPYLSKVNDKRLLTDALSTWEKRLQICIDSAEALHYLHTGCSSRMIHGHFTPFNILLDENYTAKVDYFGHSKLSPFIVDSYVKSPLDYIYTDPVSITTRRLTAKSDVYSFGVVLLDILCGRMEYVYESTTEEQKRRMTVNWRTAHWGMPWLKRGQLQKIIDPALVGKIKADSLKEFARIVEKCLSLNPEERPVMREVLWGLEMTLEMQI